MVSRTNDPGTGRAETADGSPVLRGAEVPGTHQPDDADDTVEQISRLSASGDLMDVARQMREMGVESLLFARPDGRITKVVTDRRIATLAGSLPTVRPTAGTSFSTSEAVPAQALSAADPNTADDRSGAGISRR